MSDPCLNCTCEFKNRALTMRRSIWCQTSTNFFREIDFFREHPQPAFLVKGRQTPSLPESSVSATALHCIALHCRRSKQASIFNFYEPRCSNELKARRSILGGHQWQSSSSCNVNPSLAQKMVERDGARIQGARHSLHPVTLSRLQRRRY